LLHVTHTHAVVDKLDGFGVAESMCPEAEWSPVQSYNPAPSNKPVKSIRYSIRADRESNAAGVRRREKIMLRIFVFAEGLAH
jgi:hypothetical protein